MNWDTFLQTAVSDDEVFHETVTGHFWHFNYPVIDPKPGEPTHVTIATTRPETMLGDTAVAVHPDPAAALDKAEAELQPAAGRRPGQGEAGHPGASSTTCASAARDDAAAAGQAPRHGPRRPQGDAAAGRTAPIPLVADEWAKPELGTGCVKITPAHDPNDYEVGQRQNLPMINILNPDGTLNDERRAVPGPDGHEGPRERSWPTWRSWAWWSKIEDREIDLAHSDRSKTPIEPLLDRPVVREDGRAGPDRRWTP